MHQAKKKVLQGIVSKISDERINKPKLDGVETDLSQYAIDDPTKATANMDDGERHGKPGHFGKGGYDGKGGPGDGTTPMDPSMMSIPGVGDPVQDPTMGGTVAPMGSTPITPTNPSAGSPQSMPSALAPLPKLRAGVGRTLKPSRFSNIRSSAKFGKKSPSAEKGSRTKEKKATLKGAVRKSAGSKGKSAGPMSSMSKMPSFGGNSARSGASSSMGAPSGV